VSAIARWTTVAETMRGWLESAASLVDLGIRLYVADIFFSSGLTKIDDWDKTVFLFSAEYHVPLLSPPVAAFLGTFGELFFPVLLVLGLATRFAALGLSVVNVMAVVSYWHVLSQNDAGLLGHIFWGVLLLVTLFHGPGKISLDHWLWRRLRPGEAARQ
jgi:putative oxidoreductase